MIAVVAMAWNNADVVRCWLSSLQQTTHEPLEFFLLDNGSDDGGATRRALETAKPRILLQNTENESIYRGWNRLLPLAMGRNPEMIVLTNDDVVMAQDSYDIALEAVRLKQKHYYLPNGAWTPGAVIPPTGAMSLVPARAAWCLFLPPEAPRIFLPVPEQLQLWYGDDWAHQKMEAAGYTLWQIAECYAYHATSTSFLRRKDYDKIVAADREAFLAAGGRFPGAKS